MDGNTISYKALDILRDKLCSFLCMHLGKLYGDNWIVEASQKARIRIPDETESMELSQCIALFYTHYSDLKSQLPNYFPKQILNFIKSMRNKVMHQQSLGAEGAYRIVDLIKSFLDEIKESDDRIMHFRKVLIKQMYEQVLAGGIKNSNPSVEDNISVDISKHHYVNASSYDIMPDLLVKLLETASHKKAIVYCDERLEYEMLQSMLQSDRWSLICVDDSMDEDALQPIRSILLDSQNIVLLSHGYIPESDFTDEISLIVNSKLPRDKATLVKRLKVLGRCTSYPEVINILTDSEMEFIDAYEDWSNSKIHELSQDLFL